MRKYEKKWRRADTNNTVIPVITNTSNLPLMKPILTLADPANSQLFNPLSR